MEVAGLEVGGLGAFEGDVERDVPLVGLEHDAQPLETLEHLDRDGPDAGVEAVGAQLPGGTDDVMHAVVDHGDEGVGHPQVRVLAHADDGEEVVGAGVQVEVVAVVEVAVARPDMAHDVGDLVDGEVVEGRETQGSTSSSPWLVSVRPTNSSSAGHISKATMMSASRVMITQ